MTSGRDDTALSDIVAARTDGKVAAYGSPVRLALALATLVCLGMNAAAVSAQSRDWALGYTHEQASVSTNDVPGTWTIDRFVAMWSRADVGGWHADVERHSRYGIDDVAVRVFGYKRATDWTPRLRLGGGATIGERIFNIDPLALGAASGNQAYGEARLAVTDRDFILGVVTIAHEDPDFSYLAAALGYKRMF